MILHGALTTLEPITPDLAARVVARDERPGDDWHAEYPFADELDPLRSLATASAVDPDFTMYLVRRTSDGLAVGGFGFFGPPDASGTVEFGYGLVPSARGAGLATEAVGLALDRGRLRRARRGGGHGRDEHGIAARPRVERPGGGRPPWVTRVLPAGVACPPCPR